jgi:Holliday junction resolvasome RuvABC endonuclease subunit
MGEGNMKRIVAGVDIGFTRRSPTALAVVEFNPRPVLLIHKCYFPRPGLEWEEAIDDIGEALAHDFGLWGIDGFYLNHLSYELPHARDNVQTAIKLAHMCGIVRRIARHCNIEVSGVQPSQAKKALTTHGVATKQQMQASALALFGEQLTEHEADACGVALAGALLAKIVA